MADTHDKATRSYNMSQIKGKNTKPEISVRKYLHAHGLRYKLHDKTLPGKPDIVLPKYKTVVFVHGCFWHGHENCKYFILPKSNNSYWEPKIFRNKIRDLEHIKTLDYLGWKVLIVWECQIKTKHESVLDNLLIAITQ